MPRVVKFIIGGALVLGASFGYSTQADAAVIAGDPYSSSYAGESAFSAVPAGSTGQASAIFYNDGRQAWLPGVVGLLVCAPDKTTCGVPWNAAFNAGWYSPSVYATVTNSIAPGQTAFFVYSFVVPAATPAGTVTTFYGDVGIIPTGALLRPEGYYHVNTAPATRPNLTLLPGNITLQQGAYQQFSVSGLPYGIAPTWTVSGGCGGITAAGLFVATAMNSASQPCSVIASALGWTGVATVSVYGAPTQLACSVTPSTIVADGGSAAAGTAVATISVRDVNGNPVANAYGPSLSVVNVTPLLATMSPTGTVAPWGGTVSVTIRSTLVPGPIQLSVSAPGLVGCNAIVQSRGAGTALRTVASFSNDPIAADGSSTSTLQVDVTDAAGVRVLSDNITQIQIAQVAGGASCAIVGVTWGVNMGSWPSGAYATVVQGRVGLQVRATTTPGLCLFSIATNNVSLPGTSATLTTRGNASAARLVIASSETTNPASTSGWCDPSGATEPSCAIVVVAVQDATGTVPTAEYGRVVTATTQGCTGAGGGDVVQRGATTTFAGRATFAFSSAGAYDACVITFSSAGLAPATTTITWLPAAADHLVCTFFPASLPVNSTAIAQATVTVRDALGNVVPSGTYPVMLLRQSGVITAVTTPAPQYTASGAASFTVTHIYGASGVDVYVPSLASGTLGGANTTCVVAAP